MGNKKKAGEVKIQQAQQNPNRTNKRRPEAYYRSGRGSLFSRHYPRAKLAPKQAYVPVVRCVICKDARGPLYAWHEHYICASCLKKYEKVRDNHA